MTNTNPIRGALLTGGHPFDVPRFHNLFRAIPDVDLYPQEIENYAMDWGGIRNSYDVLVFYNIHREQPAEGPVAELPHRLGETGQCILVLHNALLAYPHSPEWAEMVGMPNRVFDFHISQEIAVEAADTRHPITRGLSGWRMPDETCTMADAGPDSQVLMTTNHPFSMRTLAWTHHYRNAPVFGYQSGQDNLAWSHPGFREVLARGIRWCADRLK